MQRQAARFHRCTCDPCDVFRTSTYKDPRKKHCATSMAFNQSLGEDNSYVNFELEIADESVKKLAVWLLVKRQFAAFYRGAS